MKFELYPLDILTSSGKYPERQESDECTTQVRVNAADLAERVTKLLQCLGLTAKVSSGFRTAQANKDTGGAKASAHMTGEAVDLEDPKNTIGAAIMRDTNLLVRFDLYLENPQHTSGWVHLQSRRTRSGNRVFTP